MLTALFGDERVQGQYLSALEAQTLGAFLDEQQRGLLLLGHVIGQHQRLLLESEARHDELTGLPNKKFFMERLDLETQLAQGPQWPIHPYLLFFDLNHFKMYNDARGHAVGDALLVETADFLRTHMRSGDLVARIGGDEFGAILQDVEPCGLALRTRLSALATDYETHMRRKMREQGIGVVCEQLRLEDITIEREYWPSFSIGARQLTHGIDPAQALAQADAAMYLAKQAKKHHHGSGIRIYKPGDCIPAEEKQAIQPFSEAATNKLDVSPQAQHKYKS